MDTHFQWLVVTIWTDDSNKNKTQQTHVPILWDILYIIYDFDVTLGVFV